MFSLTSHMYIHIYFKLGTGTCIQTGALLCFHLLMLFRNPDLASYFSLAASFCVLAPFQMLVS